METLQTLYLNGVASGTFTGWPGATINRLLGDTSDQNMHGDLIDEIAVYGYALTAHQVTNHYALRTSTTATVSTAAAADSSGRGFQGVVNSGVTMGQASALADGNAAMSFDGGDGGNPQKVRVNSAGAAIHGTSAITVEAWVNARTLPASGALRTFALWPDQTSSYLAVFSNAGTSSTSRSSGPCGKERMLPASGVLGLAPLPAGPGPGGIGRGKGDL